MKKEKNKKWEYDFFIINKKHHYFIIPALIYFHNKDAFYETNVKTTVFGISIRWFTIMVGLQFEKNPHYKKDN